MTAGSAATRRASRVAASAGALAAGVVVWWAATVAFDVPAFVLPSPVAVVDRLADSPGLYLRNAWHTLRKVVYGGAVGVASGFALAVVVANVPVARRALYPYLVTLRVLPKIAIAPLLLIYMGTGLETALVFVALVAFFPMVVSAAAGFETTPDRYLDLLRSVDAGPVRTFLAVRVPYGLPDVFAGVKQAVTLSVIGAVVAEWVVSDEGLGVLVLAASENVQTDVMLAALAVLFVEGVGLYGLVALVQRAVLARGYGRAPETRADGVRRRAGSRDGGPGDRGTDADHRERVRSP